MIRTHLSKIVAAIYFLCVGVALHKKSVLSGFAAVM